MANETCNQECMPHIGADGFWYVGAEYTGVRAAGKDGITPNIGADGYWYIWDKNMGIKAVGEQGLKGEKGEKGDQGDQGKIGPPGAQGATGPKGDTGTEGPQGKTGVTGPKGDPGVAGPQGLQGVQGPKGAKGDIGAQGIQGPKGDVGPQGIQGPAGPVNIANNLATEKEGYALDARQGKVLGDTLIKTNDDLIKLQTTHEYLYFDLIKGNQTYITVEAGENVPFTLTQNKCNGMLYSNRVITITDDTIKLVRVHAAIGGSSDNNRIWIRLNLDGHDYVTSLSQGTYINAAISCIIPVRKGSSISIYPNEKVYAGSGGLMNYMYIERVV